MEFFLYCVSKELESENENKNLIFFLVYLKKSSATHNKTEEVYNIYGIQHACYQPELNVVGNKKKIKN